MKKILLAGAMVATASLALHDVSVGHGGTYRGPGDTVPPAGGGGGGGGGGPSTPGPSGPSAPGPSGPSTPTPATPGAPGAGPGGKPNNPSTAGASSTGADLTVWSFWWGFNKDPYLNLRASIHSGGVVTGSDDFFLGQGQKDQAKDSLRPSEEVIRSKVVPALVEALKNERNNDIVTGAMIALAKIGDAKSESGESEFEKLFAARLDDPSQEIAETSAVAMGILANPAAIPTLEHLLRDDAEGQKLVGSNEVNWRTRAFAAYGLGLIGNRVSDNATRQDICRILVEMIQAPRMSTRDIKVACIISMGLVPIDPVEGETMEGTEEMSVTDLAVRSRQGQIRFLLDYFKDRESHYLIQAHVPRALAKLMDGAPADLREEALDALLDGCGRHTKFEAEVRQSCVLALGQIGDLDEDKLDEKIRDELYRNVKESQNQERYFALISLAQIAGRPGEGEGEPEAGLKKIQDEMMRQMSKGKSRLRPWAGLASGVMGRAIADSGRSPNAAIASALRSELADCGAPQDVGAYAVACGLRKDPESVAILLKHLEKFSDDTARGDVAVALGLTEDRSAIKPIQTIVRDSKYRPELLKQTAIALGLLGDKEIVPDLVEMLRTAKGLSSQAAISSALGFIGDARSVDPLVDMLTDKSLTDRARGFAAVALGIVADKELLPWNSKISVDINYRANTVTLTSPSQGTGLLDFL